ncbi:MAG TPA: BadF/BadG/BcrA/BcrD ATPase family protein [Patescibacteria group bacterium]|nr:BadF/BadG/BcrA/BcrD ATPase family protein [Patescibacteria group bacterium]
MSYLLGIDIGGTKFHLRARPQKGRDVNLVVPAIGHIHEIGSGALIRDLAKHVKVIQQKMGKKERIEAVCIGMAGIDTAKDHRDVLRELNKQSWWKQADPNRRILVNDLVIGLRAGTENENSMALISGTGSNACVFEDGEQFCVSGRGHLLADEGSGYAIGLAGLKAATKAEDGRGSRTKILPIMLSRFRASEMGDIPPKLDNARSKSQIGALNDVVEKAAEAGDRVARKIIKEAADELILMLTTLKKRMSSRPSSIDVVLIGGTINKNKPLRNEVIRRARKHRWMNIVPLTDDPVEGAIILAEETR